MVRTSLDLLEYLSMNIGVFDSGLGGLSILREIIGALPDYHYVYLGDSARVPYGGRSPELIYEFTREAVDFLFSKNCALIILACNTASAVALRRIQQEYLPTHFPDKRVLGVIRPTVEVVAASSSKRVGVIGTQATISSESFVKEIKKLNNTIKVFQKACPLLVPIIEEGELEWSGLTSILEKYLVPLQKEHIEKLILGCTHYGLIKETIQRILGKHIEIISQGEVVAMKLKEYLSRHFEIASRLEENKKREYYVTDLNDRYKSLVKLFLGEALYKDELLRCARLAS